VGEKDDGFHWRISLRWRFRQAGWLAGWLAEEYYPQSPRWRRPQLLFALRSDELRRCHYHRLLSIVE
jgi:hypothetical protein